MITQPASARWSGLRLLRRRSLLVVAVLLALVALIPGAVAQQARRPPVVVEQDPALQALNEGRYDEVAKLTASRNQSDPAVVALIARADIARGRYAEAEARLRPIAVQAPTSEAALELGLLLDYLSREDASAVLTRIAARAEVTRDPQELGRAARALAALNQAQDANAAFRDATAALPRDAALHTAWGELWLQTFNNAEALRSYQDALREHPQYVPALLGAARALADDNPPQSLGYAQQALKINPSSVETRVFVASQTIDAGKRDEARVLLTEALAINPGSLEAHAYLAGLAYVEDKIPEFDEHVKRTLALAPRDGEVYRVAGQLAARNYRFEEAVTLVRRALQIEPRNPRSLADLGVHLLRTGHEPEARQVLEASFKIDPYDLVTFNLLTMMDTLDTFVTVERGDIVLRLHPDEAPVMTDFVMELAQDALATFEKRYNFDIQGPILIEVFTKHDDFAVRNVGLPGMIGALGACFGKVVTMDSPRARPPGDFQWEATLWHELAHVVTLQMSRQRVPRWLTEGVSVYEEVIERPEWARTQDMQFVQVLNQGEAIKLADLNEAFTDPRTISLAYYQASLVVEHLVERFGDAGLHRLIRAYGDGLDSTAALKAALETSFEDLQKSYDAMVDTRFASLRAALELPKEEGFPRMPLDELRVVAAAYEKSYPAQLALAHALRREGDINGALAAFEKAAALVPNAIGDDSPNQQIAAIALEQKNYPRAIAALEAILSSDFDNVLAARELAATLIQTSVTDPKRLEPVYRRIASIDPFDAEAHAAVGRMAMQRSDPAAAVRAFRAVLALKPLDRAAAHADLAESYLRSGQRTDARRQTLAALEIAPGYRRAQDLLLELAGDRP
jgi:tetratricopeptide (TPR) repeat protein